MSLLTPAISYLLFPLDRFHDVEVQHPRGRHHVVVVAPVGGRLQGHLVRHAGHPDQPPQYQRPNVAAGGALEDVVHVELEGVPAQDDVRVHAPQQVDEGIDHTPLGVVALHANPRDRVAPAEGDYMPEIGELCSQCLYSGPYLDHLAAVSLSIREGVVSGGALDVEADLHVAIERFVDGQDQSRNKVYHIDH
jgi:hypothetical protein